MGAGTMIGTESTAGGQTGVETLVRVSPMTIHFFLCLCLPVQVWNVDPAR